MKLYAKMMLVVALLLLGGGLLMGQVAAQPPTEPPTDPPPSNTVVVEAILNTLNLSREEAKVALQNGQTLAELAETQGVAFEAVVNAGYEAAMGQLNTAVAEGRLTEAQAAQLEERFTARREACLSGGECQILEPPKNHGPGQRAYVRQVVGFLSQTLNLTPQELLEARRDGQTLPELIEQQGLTVPQVAEAFYGEITLRVETAVAEGRISPERGDQFLNRVEARYTACVNTGDCPFLNLRR